MIVALHVATGAATGALTGSRAAAIVLGPILHVASDRVPHRHPCSSRDVMAGAVALSYVACRRGILDPATVGALAAIAPDLKHTRRKPGGPRWRPRPKPRGLRVRWQLLLAAALLAPLPSSRRRSS
jgi:hypothetical protein